MPVGNDGIFLSYGQVEADLFVAKATIEKAKVEDI